MPLCTSASGCHTRVRDGVVRVFSQSRGWAAMPFPFAAKQTSNACLLEMFGKPLV